MFITGHDLKRMRIKTGKTTEQVKDIVGIKSRKTIENWEAGRSEPSHNQFIQLSIAYGYDTAKLIDLFMNRATLETEADISQAHKEE